MASVGDRVPGGAAVAMGDRVLGSPSRPRAIRPPLTVAGLAATAEEVSSSRAAMGGDTNKWALVCVSTSFEKFRTHPSS